MDENVNTSSEDTGNEAQYTEVEQRALEMGWRPKTDFEGDESDFIDAKEFVQRKPLYDKISHQSKQLKNLTSAIEALKVHNGKVQEAAYQKAIKDIREQRSLALRDGEFEKFEQLDDELRSAEKQVEIIREEFSKPIVKEEQEIHPTFSSWLNQNPWYQSTKYMRDFADDVGKELAAAGMSPEKVLEEVAKRTRKEFPHKFSNPNKQSAPDVGASKGPSNSKSVELNMPEEDRKIMNTILRAGGITKEEYIKQYKLIQGKGN